MMTARWFVAVAGGLMLIGTAALCPGAPRTWTGGAGNSDWFADANWGGQHPLDGDDATIGSGATVVLSANSAALSALTVTNATLVFSNWTTTLYATNVFVRNTGVLDLPPGFTVDGPSNRIHVVCSNLSLDAGAAINANAGGYVGTNGPGAGYMGIRHRGGGYGGRGGSGYYGDSTGYTYGDAAAPQECGSGGGGDIASGGVGGGAVYIQATGGVVTLNGTVSADGGPGSGQGGGGSGGGIHIECHTLDGSGLVTANGGDGTSLGGGGGGGRIALHYADVPGGVWPGLRLRAAPGSAGTVTYRYTPEPGTVWLPDTVILTANMSPGLLTSNVVAYFDSGSLWAGASLSVISNSFRVATTGFQFKVTGGVVVGAGGNLDLPNLDCAGAVLITNGGALRVHGDPTNATMTYGGLLAVTNTLTIASNSTLWVQSDPTNGGSPLILVDTLAINRYGTLSGYGYGYKPTYGPGAGSGTYVQERGSGGGHGGKGGIGTYGPVSLATSGQPAGQPDQPVAGSGGCNPEDGGWGGALLQVQAATVTIDGTINADGSGNGRSHGGGGSGGGVVINCVTLNGSTTGVIRANGGTTSSSVAGGGGGGRIALRYHNATPWPGFHISCSPGGTAYAGCFWTHLADQGTVYLSDASALSTVMDNSRFTDVTLFISNTSAWNVDSLTVSNCSFRMGDTVFQLTVTNDVLIATNGRFGVANLECGGNLIVANGGKFEALAGPTNGVGPAYGGLIDVANDIHVGDGSWIYAVADETNGGAPLFRAGAVVVSATTNSGFDASARGLLGGHGTGKGDPSQRQRAGGYGGRGGYGAYGDSGGGITYGFSNAPALTGSGGGGDTTFATVYPCASGYGGGLLWIEARGAVTLNGALLANGGNAAIGQTGGGSGGGIFVSCSRFTGAGVLQANGGNGASASAGGGGGRIAVARGLSDAQLATLLSQDTLPHLSFSNGCVGFTGNLQVSGGTGVAGTGTGAVGTVQFLQFPYSGVLISIL